jgi:hypothetical protein
MTEKLPTPLEKWQLELEEAIASITTIKDEKKLQNLGVFVRSMDEFARYDRLFFKNRLWWYAWFGSGEAWVTAVVVGKETNGELISLPIFCVAFWLWGVGLPFLLKPDIDKLDHANHRYLKAEVIGLFQDTNLVKEPIDDKRRSQYLKRLLEKRREIKKKYQEAAGVTRSHRHDSLRS